MRLFLFFSLLSLCPIVHSAPVTSTDDTRYRETIRRQEDRLTFIKALRDRLDEDASRYVYLDQFVGNIEEKLEKVEKDVDRLPVSDDVTRQNIRLGVEKDLAQINSELNEVLAD